MMSPSSGFKIAETKTFQSQVKKIAYRRLYSKITSYIYPQLRINPYFGPNIKKLTGELDQYYRWRLGKYRLFYQINSDKVIVFIVGISHRKDAY